MDNDSLFALKVYYEDEHNDEHNIIRMLKIELFNQGMNEDDANNRLKEFYDSFGSNIDIEVFKNIIVRRYQILNSLLSNISNQINELENNDIENNDIENNDIEDNDLENNIIENNNFLLLYTYNTINHTENDVILTLNEEDRNNLKKYIVENNVQDKCLICYDNIKVSEEVIELQCNHIYHTECINEYFSKYNYKCPCCK